MNRSLLFLSLTLVAGCNGETPYEPTDGGDPEPAVAGETHAFDFEDADVGGLPDSFVHVLGDWQVSEDATAPSGSRVLLQSGAFASPDFPRILLESLTFQDPVVSVKCSMDEGSVDQACGVLFRAEDSENYYITRANVLEGNIRLYHVVDGTRVELASIDMEVTGATWHTLEARAVGSKLTVHWDGEEVLSSDDTTFTGPGKVGIWLKADSVTAFDDFSATETAGE